MFSFNSMYLSNRGRFSCPVKSLFIFSHNQPLSPDYLKSHPLVLSMSPLKTADDLLAFLDASASSSAYLPTKWTVHAKTRYTLIDFDGGFYQERFA